MDNVKNNTKEFFAINCREIPETIFVETRFITLAAAKQKKNEQIFYLINKCGQLELTRKEEQFVALKNYRNTTKPTTAAVSMQSLQTTAPLPTVQQSQIQPVMSPLRPIHSVPLATALTNIANNELRTSTLLNLKPTNAVVIPNVTIPISNTSQLQTLNMNANMLPTKPLESVTKRSFNDHIQQTDISAFSMKSIAIQCQLGEETEGSDDWPYVTEESMENTENIEIDKENFLKFVKDNSVQYKNSYRECLICGEVCKTRKYLYGHMAIHRGPKILCSKCGHYLDNEDLFRQHNCRKLALENRIFLHCPHYGCGVIAISKLELFDHINEHNNHRMYKCTGCQIAFCTRQEFLRHILIRAKCYTGAKRKKFCIFNLERQRDRLCRVRVFTLHTFKNRTILVTTFLSQRVPKQGMCKICLRSFANNYVFKRHRVKCVAKFRKRLIRKRYGLTNV